MTIMSLRAVHMLMQPVAYFYASSQFFFHFTHVTTVIVCWVLSNAKSRCELPSVLCLTIFC